MQIKQYSLLTPAISSALNLSEVKNHLKLTDADYDDQLLFLIDVVSGYAEKVTGRDLINKTWKGYLDSFRCDCSCIGCESPDSIQIRKSKLQSITSIQYYKNNILTTTSSSDYYFTDSSDYATICLVDGKSWPTDTDNRKQAVVITFVAGYGDDDCDIPKPLKQAMLLHLASLFENAGDCADGAMDQFKYLYNSFTIPSSFLRVV